MSNRFMRVFVFFDLPVLTSSDRREYRKFRKHLIKAGFVMQQESVYSKLVLNSSVAKTVASHIENMAPPCGVVELLIVTEKQYENIKYITGNECNEYVTSTERLIIL